MPCRSSNNIWISKDKMIQGWLDDMQPYHVRHASEFSLFLEVWVQFGLLRMMRVIRIVRVIKIIRVTGTFTEIQSGQQGCEKMHLGKERCFMLFLSLSGIVSDYIKYWTHWSRRCHWGSSNCREVANGSEVCDYAACPVITRITLKSWSFKYYAAWSVCKLFFFSSVLTRYDILTSQGDEILLRTANVDATRPESCLSFRCLPKSSQMTMMTTWTVIFALCQEHYPVKHPSSIPSFVSLGHKSATALIVVYIYIHIKL